VSLIILEANGLLQLEFQENPARTDKMALALYSMENMTPRLLILLVIILVVLLRSLLARTLFII
jgi:hypothetical protein